ncbi:hypothetical protein AVEN_252032-1 [Araneus ventricosus]|uniref:Uncharacterized protein n=1 Tax=Araneus ventricosus TaxID=182803 RepID=A0A4Y2RXN4_ARAVE|nr:hypothetical protein AVEN_252032-1 [Araneus ventricosus]
MACENRKPFTYGYSDLLGLLRLLTLPLSKWDSGTHSLSRESLTAPPHVSTTVAFQSDGPIVQMDFKRGCKSKLSITTLQFPSVFALATDFGEARLNLRVMGWS